MALTPGTRLGPYEITAQIGEGGMGEVYQATDTNLARQVAIKVLPASVASDPERLARFDREARTLAALNHPNIAQIHGLEKSAGTIALVMELVEGPTLADRVGQGAIPVDEALPIAKQIAEALEAAHEQGIIHRDLKPANIKVRPDGTVKVLDFGLAKAMESPSAMSPGMSQAPTITTPAMTQAGMILGTAAYMSPEQAKGRTVDKRSDVWAFGAVLYEMLAGRRAFDAEDVPETLAAVLMKEPDWAALPTMTPPTTATVLRRCLQKERKHRARDIGDVALALEGAFETGGLQPMGSDVAPQLAVWRRALPLTLAAMLVGGIVVGLATWNLVPRDPRPVARFDYDLPDGHVFRFTGRAVMAFSPDGRHFVYNTTEGLYLRSMGALDARLIPGTEGNLGHPFFSPDGESVAYFQDDAFKRIAITGGAPVVICAATAPFGASWARDNTILFGQPEGILRVSANGGTPELVIAAAEGEQMDGPQLLPDAESVLFSVTTAAGATRWDQAQIVVQSLGTGERTMVLQGGSDARYVPTGHLVYAREASLFAVAFDANRLEVQGAPVSVVEGVTRGGGVNTGTANYELSDQGTLVYVTGGAGLTPSTLAWVDRNGVATSVTDRAGTYRAPRISPDGARIAVAMDQDGNEDIWVVDTERGTQTRLTSDPASDLHPLWTPDGTRIAFSSNRAGDANALYWMAADGSDAPEALTETASNQGATSWLPDGSAVAFYDVGPYDIFTLKPGESPVRFLETAFREQAPTFSPDGRWLAYSSDETGQAEIYVAPYPGPGGKIAISSNGGRSPRWSPDGRELFFRNGRQMLAVAVEPGPALGVGAPRLLFEGDYLPEPTTQGAHDYDVAGDGQRFIMLAPAAGEEREDERPRVVVVQNWFEELRRLVPTP